MALERWTAVEKSLMKNIYPTEGAEGVRAYMPNRSIASIRARACRMDLAHLTSAYSHPHSAGEPAVPLPAPHEYAPEDRAWMATRLPVFVGGFGAARISA